jgi:hypothetical protein
MTNFLYCIQCDKATDHINGECRRCGFVTPAQERPAVPPPKVYEPKPGRPGPMSAPRLGMLAVEEEAEAPPEHRPTQEQARVFFAAMRAVVASGRSDF